MKVLIAVDGSDNSAYAVKWFMNNVYQASHHLILAHIGAPLVPTYLAGAGLAVTPDVVSSYYAEAEKLHDNIKQRLAEEFKQQKSPVSFEHIREEGDPGHRLCAIAKERNVDMVVMGTRGLGTVRRTILGSVSDYVLHHAHCPVIICKK